MSNSLRTMSHFPIAIGLLLAVGIAIWVWRYYRKETRALSAPYGWLLPLLKSAAVFLLMLTFLEPVIHHRTREGEPGRIEFLLDASQSMTMTDAAGQSAALSKPVPNLRYQRAAQWLLQSNEFALDDLASEFDIRILRMNDGSSDVLWESNQGQFRPLPGSTDSWKPERWSRATGIGDGLRTIQWQTIDHGTVKKAMSSNPAIRTAVVLLTDGQSNSGVPPGEVTNQMGSSHSIFSLGFGSTDELPDLAIVSLAYSPRVYRSDILRGTLDVKDRISKGKAYRVEILFEGKPVWQQSFSAEAQKQRSIEFALHIEPLFDSIRAKLPSHVQFSLIPLTLTARIVADAEESNLSNNEQTLSLAVATQRSRVLLIDSRSRWETRYLRNMFDRDPAWQVETILSMEPETFRFPATREDLFRYDLIVLGDVPADALTSQQKTWLRAYVEFSGGGLAVIAGAERNLAHDAYESLHACLPIKWLNKADSETIMMIPKTCSLSTVGQSLAAFRIDPKGEEESRQLWSQLPAIQFVDDVQVLPGSETLVHATSSLGEQPLFVTRRFGAGRVLFVATDETWRWRYKVADLVHQRLWNQVARWVMRTPMAVQSEFVSLDSGGTQHDLGKRIEIRAQLRDASARPASNLAPVTIIQRDGITVMQLPMTEEPNVPGSYQASPSELPAGDYSAKIQAAGFSQVALEIDTKFTVTEPSSVEMQDVNCNETLLKELAQSTGGKYFHESQADQLIAFIKPLSRGRYVESDTMIWQTYGWFIAALTLLVLDWWLRKRAGLV
jgi:uncharacterized membrane protein